jgi:hypothetical protein
LEACGLLAWPRWFEAANALRWGLIENVSYVEQNFFTSFDSITQHHALSCSHLIIPVLVRRQTWSIVIGMKRVIHQDQSRIRRSLDERMDYGAYPSANFSSSLPRQAQAR